MVVMEYIDKGVTFNHLVDSQEIEKSKVYDLTKALVDDFHCCGFVHGDLRPNNVIVSIHNNNRVCLIDFDWAGSIGNTFYPSFMNHLEISWHRDAIEKLPIHVTHDLHLLEQFVEF
jgi:RIO-like serine/threonine protein kinase